MKGYWRYPYAFKNVAKALRPLPTELLRIPPLNLSGRFPPQVGCRVYDVGILSFWA